MPWSVYFKIKLGTVSKFQDHPSEAGKSFCRPSDDLCSSHYLVSLSVDVRTQAMYQMMDQGFVGLIFSCFIEDKNTKVSNLRDVPALKCSGALQLFSPADYCSLMRL